METKKQFLKTGPDLKTNPSRKKFKMPRHSCFQKYFSDFFIIMSLYLTQKVPKKDTWPLFFLSFFQLITSSDRLNLKEEHIFFFIFLEFERERLGIT